MRRSLAICLAPWILAAAEPPNHLSPEEARDGWHLLFDGERTGQWLAITGTPFPASCWRVEDGCLKAFPSPGGVQDIRTRESFGDFEFRFDWKIASGGNSGVKYLIQRIDEWRTPGTGALQARARGFEYQLTDDAHSTEAARDPSRGTASLYGVLAARTGAGRPSGEFNHSRIVVCGQHVEHWLNGSKVLEFEWRAEGPAALARSLLRNQGTELVRESPLSLQNHNSEVWFRNLKVKRLR